MNRVLMQGFFRNLKQFDILVDLWYPLKDKTRGYKVYSRAGRAINEK